MDQVEPKKKINPKRIKHYINALALACKKTAEKRQLKSQISKKLLELKEVAMHKDSSKSDLYGHIKELETQLSKVLKDEKELITEQREEHNMINLLKEKIEELNNRVEQINSPSKTRKNNLDLEKNTIDINKIENKILEKIEVRESKFQKKVDEIDDIRAELTNLEKTHSRLASSGSHPEEHINKLKEIINSHKAAINEIEKSKIKAIPKLELKIPHDVNKKVKKITKKKLATKSSNKKQTIKQKPTVLKSKSSIKSNIITKPNSTTKPKLPQISNPTTKIKSSKKTTSTIKVNSKKIEINTTTKTNSTKKSTAKK
ncbi:hypothetical protein HN587_08000 [Candidatus Woesearchaeota archaeon]|jgi:DNA repair exonuclease SbcCD ATPase subunit|nr:hypothetical protein [Candidatus Woesearchaeota archaeon]